MRCDLSQYDDEFLLDVVTFTFEDGTRENINVFLLDGFFLMHQKDGIFVSPVSGKYLSEDQVLHWLSKTSLELELQNAYHEQVTKGSWSQGLKWTPSQMNYIRMAFWTFMINRLVQLVTTNGIPLSELIYLAKHVFHGSLRECPTQTMHDLVAVRYLLNDFKESHVYDNIFEVGFLFDITKFLLHFLLTSTTEQTLEELLLYDSPQHVSFFAPDPLINALVQEYIAYDAHFLIAA